MSNILDKIITDKKNSVESYKKSHPLEKIKKNISEYNNYIAFKDKLTKNKTDYFNYVELFDRSYSRVSQYYEEVSLHSEFVSNAGSVGLLITFS